MPLSAMPATQRGAAPQVTNGDQARHQVQQVPRQGRCFQVPRLQRQRQIDISKRHACHGKRK